MNSIGWFEGVLRDEHSLRCIQRGDWSSDHNAPRKATRYVDVPWPKHGAEK